MPKYVYSEEVQQKVVALAQERDGDGWSHTYEEIAGILDIEETAISPICIRAGLRRVVRDVVKTEADILNEIHRLETQLRFRKTQAKATWATDGNSILISNAKGRTHRELINAIKVLKIG